MPQLIRCLDEKVIEGPEVSLYFRFVIKTEDPFDEYFPENDEERLEQVLKFCKKHGIEYELLGPERWSGYLSGGPMYLYVDVPFDESNEQYQLLCQEFENENGSMKYDNCMFCFAERKMMLEKWRNYQKRLR